MESDCADWHTISRAPIEKNERIRKINKPACGNFSQLAIFAATTTVVQLWSANHRRFKESGAEKHLGDIIIYIKSKFKTPTE